MKKVVAIGGGTGLSTLLRGLREGGYDITAIVTMTDDGASSGRLRRNLGILPPGDIRKCIAALASDETGLNELFEYRYTNGFGLKGHSVGNLLITALYEKYGSFELAVAKMSDLLNINGRVLPATLNDVHLVGTFDSGKIVTGQEKIVRYGYGHKLTKIALTNKVVTNQLALKAIADADYILIGPGSLYTSILPNFLQPKMAKAVMKSTAKKVYICNVSTERGETSGYTVEDHVEALQGTGVAVDFVLVNDSSFPAGSGDGFVTPLIYRGEDERFIKADIVDEKNPLYHDSNKLADSICKIVHS